MAANWILEKQRLSLVGVFCDCGRLKICPWSRMHVVSDVEHRKLMCIMVLETKNHALKKRVEMHNRHT